MVHLRDIGVPEQIIASLSEAAKAFWNATEEDPEHGQILINSDVGRACSGGGEGPHVVAKQLAEQGRTAPHESADPENRGTGPPAGNRPALRSSSSQPRQLEARSLVIRTATVSCPRLMS